MNIQKYTDFLRKTNHTQKSIDSRIYRLEKIEKTFHLDIDTIIYDKTKVINLLVDMKTKKIDSSNQNLSNALRKYYTCMTNDELGRIF